MADRPGTAKRKLLNDARLRAVLAQLVVMAAVIALFAVIFDNTLDNLARRGITSGFGFLGASAGFGIIMSLIEYSEASTFGRAFLVGLLNTLLVAAIGIVLATVIGFAIGIARLSDNWLVARIAGIYVETVRNVPLLLQLFFWYFAVLRTLPGPRDSLAFGGMFLNNRGFYLPWPVPGPDAGWFALGGVVAALLAHWVARRNRGRRVRGLRRILPALFAFSAIAALAAVSASASWDRPALSGFNFIGGVVLIPEFVALTLALSIYTASFIAEIVRAGILAVPRGQTEAAAALGLSHGRTLRLVVLPQALRVIVPPLTSQYLNLTKNSSLAAAIAFPDLVSVFGGTVLNITGQAVEVIAITMSVYLAISLIISLTMNRYNRAVMARGGRGDI